MIPDYWVAVDSLVPGAEYSAVGEQITAWYSSAPQPSDEEIRAELARLMVKYDAQEYARKRAAEYPGIDQLIVALWESSVEGRPASAAELQALREAIKQKYPKPS